MSNPLQTKNEFVEVFSDIAALARAAAQRFVRLAKEAVAIRGVFTVSLSGGSTPKSLYALMATDPNLRVSIPWSEIHFFFGDERHVSPDNTESNFRMANEAMFQRLSPYGTNVHRIHTEQPDAAQAASEYKDDLAEFFHSHRLMVAGVPRFDLIFLGMGPDGHTASLFPHTSALHETDRWMVANWVEKFKAYRITMTFPVLNNAAEVILCVAGFEKASMVREVLERTVHAPQYPVQMVQPNNGIKRWMLDKAAASQLTK